MPIVVFPIESDLIIRLLEPILQPEFHHAFVAMTLKNDKTLFAKLDELINEHNIVGVYLGKPKHLSGLEGATVELVSQFAQRFDESFSLPITYVDERLTSGGAEKLLKSAGKNSRESKGLIDQLAAVAILELGIQIEKRS